METLKYEINIKQEDLFSTLLHLVAFRNLSFMRKLDKDILLKVTSTYIEVGGRECLRNFRVNKTEEHLKKAEGYLRKIFPEFFDESNSVTLILSEA